MSRIEFKNIIYFLMEKQDKMAVFYDIFKSDFLIDISDGYFDTIITLTQKLMGDDNEWLSWWVFECDYGKSDPVIWIDDVEHQIDSIDKLYNLITRKI